MSKKIQYIASEHIFRSYFSIRLTRKYFRFFSSKIFIFYKISITPFNRAKFQLSESVLQITER